MPKPRILFLNSCVSGGGPGRSLSLYLKQATHIEAHLVMPNPGVVAATMPAHAHLHYIPEFIERPLRPPYAWAQGQSTARHLTGGIAALLSSTHKITTLARTIKPSLIYCNHMLAKPVGTLVGMRLGLPVVFHARNIHDHPWIESAAFQLLARRRCVKRILCNSEATAKSYRQVADDKVRVIPNAVDFSVFDRQRIQPQLKRKLGLSDNTLVIGYAGRLMPWKGVDRLIHAFARIHTRLPQSVLAIVGGNDGSVKHNLQQQYQQLAQQLGIQHKVHFTGFQKDVHPQMIDFDMLVLPSIKPEPFGRVIVEAMALGIPAVVTAQGGAKEIVRDGIDGLWAQPQDTEDLGNTMLRLAQALQQGQFKANDIIRSARERFDTVTISQQISAELATLLV